MSEKSMQALGGRRRLDGLPAGRHRKRPRVECDYGLETKEEMHGQFGPIPGLPSDVWGEIAWRSDLGTKAVIAQVCRNANHGVGDMMNIQLGRSVAPEASLTEAPCIARVLRELGTLLAQAPCMGRPGAGAALRNLACRGTHKREAYLSLETATSFLGLVATDVPDGITARIVGMPRSKCTVQHRGPTLQHAPGYRVECATVYPVSYLLRRVVETRGTCGMEAAVACARWAVGVLEKRKTRGRDARKILEDRLIDADVREEDVAYITGLDVVRDGLFGLDRPEFESMLNGALDVHRRLRPRYLWLWVNDGKARRKATLFLKKGLDRDMPTGQLVEYLEAKFWWATHHIASMPVEMRVAEENEFGDSHPISPASSTASSSSSSSGTDTRALRIPTASEGRFTTGCPNPVVDHLSTAVSIQVVDMN